MLKGYRTYILAGLGVVSAVVGYLVGDTTLPEALQQGATSAALIFLRNAV